MLRHTTNSRITQKRDSINAIHDMCCILEKHNSKNESLASMNKRSKKAHEKKCESSLEVTKYASSKEVEEVMALSSTARGVAQVSHNNQLLQKFNYKSASSVAPTFIWMNKTFKLPGK